MTENWDERMAGLPTRWLGRTWRFLPEVDSTNRYARERAAELGHGAVVAADFQSAGRGRLGRSWQAPPGTSLLTTLLLRPDWPGEQAGWLTMIAGTAVVEAVAAITGLPAALKWPNDIVREGPAADRLVKLGGILVEADLAGGRLALAAVGIGLNVHTRAADLPDTPLAASSLHLEGGQALSRPALLVELLTRFEARCEAAERGESPLPAWRSRLVTLGRPVTVQEIGASAAGWNGTAEDVDEAGRLLVRDENGALRAIAAADVTLRQPN